MSCGFDDKAPPRRLDHWQSDLLQVVDFQDTANLGLLMWPRQRAVLRPERIIDPRQPVDGESFQYQQRYRQLDDAQVSGCRDNA